MYYIPNQRDNRNSLIFLIILMVLLVVFCCTANSQVRKVWYDPIEKAKITSFFPETPMKFRSVDNDTIFLTVRADSMLKDSYRFRLTVKYPKSVKAIEVVERLRLDFDNEITDYFIPVLIHTEDNSIDYMGDLELLADLRYKKVTWVAFAGIAQAPVREERGNRDYFNRFLSEYLR